MRLTGAPASRRTTKPPRNCGRSAQAFSPAAIVTLDRAVSFRGGVTASVFRMRFVRRRTPIFEPVDRPGYWCRLTLATLAAATITQVDEAVVAG